MADNATSVTPVGKATINVRRIDSFCDEHDIDSIDVLKIDTQGYEHKVLEGAGRLLGPQHIRFIYLEVAFVSLYEQQAEFYDIYQKIALHGYKFIGLYGLVRDILKWGNALFMADRLAGGHLSGEH